MNCFRFAYSFSPYKNKKMICLKATELLKSFNLDNNFTDKRHYIPDIKAGKYKKLRLEFNDTLLNRLFSIMYSFGSVTIRFLGIKFKRTYNTDIFYLNKEICYLTDKLENQEEVITYLNNEILKLKCVIEDRFKDN